LINLRRDTFICHASADKQELVRPLVQRLAEKNVTAWYDEDALAIGDSLERAIDRGLDEAEHGIVVLSPAFFAAKGSWTRRELDALRSRHLDGHRRLLVIWHGVDEDEVGRRVPELRDLHAARSSDGIDRLVDQLLPVLAPALVRASVGGTAIDLLEIRPGQHAGDNVFSWTDQQREQMLAGETGPHIDFHVGLTFALRALRPVRLTRLEFDYTPGTYVHRPEATVLRVDDRPVELDGNFRFRRPWPMAPGTDASVSYRRAFRLVRGLDPPPQDHDVVRLLVDLDVDNPPLSRAYRVDGKLEPGGRLLLLTQGS
jgi:TIR domain